MPAHLEEITATYLGERHRFANADGDVVIATAWANSDINAEITIKGQADLDELNRDQTYRFYGRWTNYKNRRTGTDERQFHFTSFVIQQPHSKQGVIQYLRAAGEGLGLGIGRASKLWELYGSDAVKTLREEPATVAERLSASGRYYKLTTEQAEKIASVLRDEAALEGCTLDLMDLLTGRGFPKSTARLATRAWGNRAAQIIRRNPYRLMAFRGCGFKKTDSLYLDLGLPPGKLKRQALCAWHTLAKDTEGHTYYAIEFAQQGIRSNIAAADLQPEKAIELANRSGYTAMLRTNTATGPLVADGQRRWLAEGKKARNEAELSEAICNAMVEPCCWPDVSTLSGVSDHQREHLVAALRGPIAILGGGPGTGKTYSAAVLIRELVKVYGTDGIGIGAPTGKAAVRVTEALSAYGLPLRARTWHSMLAMIPRTGGTHFPYKVLIGDETSMNDTDLMASIFRCRAAGTHVLLVGDVNQLPPVGHGAPLRDLIAAGLPYGELREIKRASGGIVESCAAIRDGKPWGEGDNLRIVNADGPEGAIGGMLMELKLQEGRGLNPIWDCQVVVPVNKKSPLSRKELNKLLQAELNHNAGIEGSPFRLGDKVVNTKNGYFPCATDPAVQAFDTEDCNELQWNDRQELYVANGELGRVVDVQPGFTVIQLENPRRTVKVPRGKAEERDTDDDQVADDNAPTTGCSWDLGFALSVHRSQGSEWPVVIVMIDDYPGARMICTREYWYTAISRAKEQCILIGKKSVVDQGCKKVAISKRKTFLKERVLLEQAKRELADL
jgi:exodeoxyribonuclease V alpha subunit